MADDRRRIAIAIGIKRAPPLAYLGGAVNSAKLFETWARSQGYATTLITDEEEPVTMARLGALILEALAPPSEVEPLPPIHRVILYFAGHGLIREMEEGLWLLSDWHGQQRAVSIDMLKRRLYRFGVEQITIISDACSSLPGDVDTADLVLDGVLGLGPQPRNSPAIDRFTAAQDGQAAYMIPGPTPKDDLCLFSGVLLEGMWGDPRARSRLETEKVTGRSLTAYLKAEAPRRAKLYNCNVEPTASTTFPEGDDYYFDAALSATPPAPVAWPPPGDLPSMGPLKPSPPWPPRFDSSFENLISFRLDHAQGGFKSDKGPPPARPARGPKTASPSGRAGRGPSGETLQDRLRAQDVPHSFETRCGFAVDGPPVIAIWTRPSVFAESGGQPGWWRIGEPGGPELRQPAPVLIEFADRTVAALTALPGFIASLIQDSRGAAGLVYRPIGGTHAASAATEDIIGQLERGALRAASVIDQAVTLRKEKHVDPVLGVISAYLYDAIDDLDSIRRMAYFYIKNSQPIPYDIALLAQIDCGYADGLLYATVPAVAARKPRSPSEAAEEWAYCATPKATGVIGGLWPWMRQGWQFLDDVVAEHSPLARPGFLDLRDDLSSSRFTAFDIDDAVWLADFTGLERTAF